MTTGGPEPLTPTPQVAAAAEAGTLEADADVGNGGRALTLRSAAAAGGAFARQGCRHVGAFSALSAWLKGCIRGGALRPKRKAQGLWLSVLVWSFAYLGMYDRRQWEEVRGEKRSQEARLEAPESKGGKGSPRLDLYG